jgi:myo-inositol-1(or 4)-monophosphatase
VDAEQVLELASSLREVVLPMLGSHAGREHDAGDRDGDVTFAIDALAEDHLEAWLAEHAPGVAYFSEDRGLVGDRDAGEVLVVDPIDGTRPAMAGFESACVSVALARAGERGAGPRMGDVVAGAIVEIKSGHRFLARRGGGVRSDLPVALSANEEVERMFWVYGLRGRPSRVVVEVLAELLDASSTRGAAFDLGSATYDMTRIVTGQLDAYVEPSPRIVAEVPGMREAWERVGHGAVLNNTPYDLAAAVLCLEEAGATVTDARGEDLGGRPLLGSGAEHQMSCVAAAGPALHAAVLEHVDAGVQRLLASNR